MLALAETVKAPEQAGWLVGERGSADIDISDTYRTCSWVPMKRSLDFAQGYTRSRFDRAGWPWVDSFDTSNWSIEQMGEFALLLPRYERRSWEFRFLQGCWRREALLEQDVWLLPERES